MFRGRPPTVQSELIVETVLKYKAELVCEKNPRTIVSERECVWESISNELSNKIKSSTIYSYVVNNKFDLRNLLCGVQHAVQNNTTVDSIVDVSDMSTIVCDEKSNFTFVLTFRRSEFNDLLLETSKSYKNIKGKKRHRTINILHPQKWTEIMAKKIYDDFPLPHGYHFDSSYINKDKESGAFTGHCNCGSRVKCRILPSLEHEQIVKINCVATPGDGKCGKRQCRGESRKEVVAELQLHSVESYRTRKAAEMMGEGEDTEPPFYYSGDVLRKAKHESLQKQYRDPSAIIALSKFKRSPEGRDVIHLIAMDPVIVHFWSPHQIRLFNDIVKRQHVRICIDATGGLAKLFQHVYQEMSQHIFYYTMVAYCSFGQFGIASMFSEIQDTVTISTWLKYFIQSGSNFPKEVNWADFLTTLLPLVKKFYMFAIGQLILCRDELNATNIIKALLVISLSEKAGDGAPLLQEAYQYIKTLTCIETVETQEMIEVIEATLKEEDKDVTSLEEDLKYFNGTSKNTLQNWATSMVSEIHEMLQNENGDDINPRYCPKFANRLQQQIKTIPMWSCICRDRFGFGRVPASSSPVENEFRNIKNQIIPKAIRIDMAVETLVKHYNGKLKLIDCAIRSHDKDTISAISQQAPTDNEACNQFNQLLTSALVSSPKIVEEKTDTLIEEFYDPSKEIMDETDNPYGKVVNLTQSETYCSPVMPYLSNRSPLKDISSKKNSENTSLCAACKNGNCPTDAHMCILCKKNVHALPGCSFEIQGEEEGYGQKRLCLECSNNSSVNQRIAYNEIENWRGLGRPKKVKKQSTYLNKGNQETIDQITSSKGRSLPLIKNGNVPGLGYVSVDNAKLSLYNTCGFDSIFQILLAVITDNEQLKSYASTHKKDNALFEMVLEVTESKITSKTYKKRAEILLDYFKKKPMPHSIEMIDCKCNVVSLTNYIFKKTPSFQEKSACRAGCVARIKKLPTIMISQKEIQTPLGDIIRRHVVLPGVQCLQTHCQATEENALHSIADIAVIGIDTVTSIEVGALPPTFVCPKTRSLYNIVGAVDYKGNMSKTRRSESIGHYTAIVKRNINWVEYDDMKTKAIPISKHYQFFPELLFYVKKSSD